MPQVEMMPMEFVFLSTEPQPAPETSVKLMNQETIASEIPCHVENSAMIQIVDVSKLAFSATVLGPESASVIDSFVRNPVSDSLVRNQECPVSNSFVSDQLSPSQLMMEDSNSPNTPSRPTSTVSSDPVYAFLRQPDSDVLPSYGLKLETSTVDDELPEIESMQNMDFGENIASPSIDLWGAYSWNGDAIPGSFQLQPASSSIESTLPIFTASLLPEPQMQVTTEEIVTDDDPLEPLVAPSDLIPTWEDLEDVDQILQKLETEGTSSAPVTYQELTTVDTSVNVFSEGRDALNGTLSSLKQEEEEVAETEGSEYAPQTPSCSSWTADPSSTSSTTPPSSRSRSRRAPFPAAVSEAERMAIARKRNNEASRRSRLKKKEGLLKLEQELKELKASVEMKTRHANVKRQILTELQRLILLTAKK
ncbi:unnamed protein product [Cyprideis torosa]|uniref:Uncharacterized protein n=1 Tax=Cyprideis torosa TaxID=163714 RepID=A0A7R8ZRW8_9CRUS|nr:unnamed protein product [Cyprideis torosa]CAG0894166.1 unnamed protein product [Cyprideis torosa]